MTTRALQSLSYEAVCDRLSRPERTLILMHRNPDGDAVGSAYALKRMLNAMGSEACCLAPGEIPQRLRFLTDGEHPDVVAPDFPAKRIICVDVASPAQLGELREAYAGRVDLMIDHHASGTPFADHLICPDASATGEILFDLAERLRAQGKLYPDMQTSARLYAAISSDTGCFRFSNATSKTHRIAAALIESGLDAAGINHLLFESRPVDQVRAEGAATGRLCFAANGKIGYVTFPYDLKQSLGVSDEHLDTLIDIPRSIAGVQVAFSVRQPTKSGVFRVSMRSACSFDVAAVCAGFGGGGHVRAAGCTLEADSLEQAVEQILGALDPEKFL